MEHFAKRQNLTSDEINYYNNYVNMDKDYIWNSNSKKLDINDMKSLYRLIKLYCIDGIKTYTNAEIYGINFKGRGENFHTHYEDGKSIFNNFL